MPSPAAAAGPSGPVPGRPRSPFLALSAPLRAYVAGVVLLAAGLLAVLAPRTAWTGGDLWTLGLLAGCACVCVEASRRQGEAAGVVARDLLAAWWLPAALLLPPAYALLVPVPAMLVQQWRVRRAPWHRRVFTTAAIGASGALGALLFGALVGVERARDVQGGALLHLAAALLTALVVSALNLLLVAVAVKADNPGLTWPEVLIDDEASLLTEAAEACMGVLIALAAKVDTTFVLLGLAPVLLLQRTLLHQQLRTAARTDAKTGLLNAAAWEREAATHLLRARRTGGGLAVLLLDLDHFKGVNDRHGHLVGDEVLRAVADTVRAQLRGYDVPCRFGGEELAVLLPDTDLDEAARTAERLRRRVAALVVLDGEQPVRVTASLGVAGLQRADQDVTDLLAAADAALYAAKEAGRDTVRVDGRPGLDVALG
ncbi:GGDEF domain-containing protein [Vallicoccus soli]|uniref:GGDEF domain-containing protein n=1 Tax=Vallicoccus soli TaxID=2339232 RepID=A0A3A3YVP6_9ACTN|nr:GGDEF domain-containing protein [Vallicoccus soli]RJK93128.1 GGDEF domain-containing protein [Vallicoccus soli]